MIQPRTMLKGRYRVGPPLGEGGMAIVYLGHDVLLGRDVAIKTPRAQYAADDTFRMRFEREARAAAALSHPNIIDVHDVGEEGGVPFLVMELVRGQSLKAIIGAEAPFHPDDVAELMGQIGPALDYAHARGYVHRDVKPGNILVDEHGRARVVDFGIAKGLADADLTDAGGGFGTAGYLSPEQAEGLMATPASDVYSAGVVAFEMLTGALPFQADTPVGLALQHVNDPAPPPSRIVPGIPAAVDAIVLRALDKDPTRRWPSVGAFAQALRTWRDVGVESPRPPSARPAPAASQPSVAPTVAVLFLVLAAVVSLLWLGWQNPLGREAPAAPTPVIVPSEPVITGGLDGVDADDAEADPEPVIEIAADAGESIEAAPTTAPIQEAPPTIAPAQAVVVVPNLQGLSIAGASGSLLPLGLRIAQGQPAYSSSVPLNAIVSQDPPAGSPVAPGTIVRVSLSRGPSPFGSNAGP